MRKSRRTMRLAFGLAAALAGFGALSSPASAAGRPAAVPLLAAFVRGGDLWVQEGDAERRLTTGEKAKGPRWSADGRWIAYLRGEEKPQLWVRNVGEPKGRLVAEDAGGDYQWAPARARLAFHSPDGRLLWADAAHPERSHAVAKEVSGFAWWPDGGGFIASTQARPLPDGGWSRVRIERLPLEAAPAPAPDAAEGTERSAGAKAASLVAPQVAPQAAPAPTSDAAPPSAGTTLYTLPAASDDFFAVGTSAFKWSADGRWAAFLATPTASLSADGNDLCVLSADGRLFRRLDRMARNEAWFRWAPSGDKLAYIAGEGREATSNKSLRVADIPRAKPVSYTPAGYVDQSFDWNGPESIVASRAREQAEWTGEPMKRPFPFLVSIRLNDRRQERLTRKSKVYGAYGPVFVPSPRTLVWVRSDRKTASVWTSGPAGEGKKKWIPELDLGADFYEQWNWDAVLAVYPGTARADG